jgi:hypothetical protein
MARRGSTRRVPLSESSQAHSRPGTKPVVAAEVTVRAHDWFSLRDPWPACVGAVTGLEAQSVRSGYSGPFGSCILLLTANCNYFDGILVYPWFLSI